MIRISRDLLGAAGITLAIVCMILLITVNSLVRAQSQDIQAGLVVQGPGGQVTTYCIKLNALHATGLDALRAAGLDINAQIGALGAAVCRIDKVGCSYPAETCFCQCQGNQCNYWSYFSQDDKKHWSYSGIGAGTHILKTGDVDGWLWNVASDQTPVGGLPAISYETICNPANAGASTASGAAGSGPNILGLGLFGAAIILIGGLLIWRRTRSS